jgi:hypothetical protein
MLYPRSTWGAAAWSSDGLTVGIGLKRFMTQEPAESAALARCTELGGGGCRVATSFYDQCSAAARSRVVISFGSGRVKEEAQHAALEECGKKTEIETGAQGNACKVTWTGCTERVL